MQYTSVQASDGVRVGAECFVCISHGPGIHVVGALKRSVRERGRWRLAFGPAIVNNGLRRPRVRRIRRGNAAVNVRRQADLRRRTSGAPLGLGEM